MLTDEDVERAHLGDRRGVRRQCGGDTLAELGGVGHHVGGDDPRLETGSALHELDVDPSTPSWEVPEIRPMTRMSPILAERSYRDARERRDAGGGLPRTAGLSAGEHPRAHPRTGEVLVRVEAVGICASDLKCYHGAAKFWGDENRPAWAETEVVPGHEIAGRVVELDDEAREHWDIEHRRPRGGGADRPVLELPVLRHRELPHVPGAQHVRLQAANPGGMEEFMVCPPSLVHTISKDIPPHTPRSPSRCPVRCTRWSGPTSPSPTPSSWRAAGRSGWA